MCCHIHSAHMECRALEKNFYLFTKSDTQNSIALLVQLWIGVGIDCLRILKNAGLTILYFSQAIKMYYAVKDFLQKRLHLQINEEKSKVVILKKGSSLTSIPSFLIYFLQPAQPFLNRSLSISNLLNNM